MRANQRFLILTTAVLLASPGDRPARGEDGPRAPRIDIGLSQLILNRIGYAFHYFHAAAQSCPIDLATADGKPLLSWRVVILPYVGEEDLYKQFKLNEPWDSAHNTKLIPKIPRVYAPIRVKAKEGETFYQVFTGEKAPFVPGKLIRIPQGFPDGTSNTGLVFEAGEPVIWTKPADLSFDDKKPLPKLGGMFGGECNVVLCDGSVQRLKKGADERQLKLLIMPDDGQPLAGNIFVE
jgi:hypothetical protein